MKAKAVLLLGLALCLSGASVADTLLLEGIQTNNQTAHERPVRGMRMDSVEQQFGSPTAKHSPVGDPPISRWEYNGFVVYFEYDRVLHAVVRLQSRES